ncbi:hypothetical protein [Arthrobacter sunyaminii]|uniref:Uncharacterized protein n=1 Tax=Arthrobacter sunyaminii TaxID=2816859 RepID=A0A975PCZ4_9MICC|nr:hypothetical protein [Arthrobacter sunyaminii]MBO0907512.1 hypothetical protein [Arthrobacter sunyaminii]QWQ35088.1 hypothetical protein KG104_11210 [Arthrobacter sunyaminii]
MQAADHIDEIFERSVALLQFRQVLERAGGLEVVHVVIRRMQDRPLTLNDRYTKLNMRTLPAWKQDDDHVGAQYCIFFLLPDGA